MRSCQGSLPFWSPIAVARQASGEPKPHQDRKRHQFHSGIEGSRCLSRLVCLDATRNTRCHKVCLRAGLTESLSPGIRTACFARSAVFPAGNDPRPLRLSLMYTRGSSVCTRVKVANPCLPKSNSHICKVCGFCCRNWRFTPQHLGYVALAWGH